MSTPDTREKSETPEKPQVGEPVASKAEKKASDEAEGGKTSFYDDMARKGRALMKAREDGITTGTHQDFGTPTLEGDDGKSIIKGGAPSKATLTQEELEERMKIQASNAKQPDASINPDHSLIAQADPKHEHGRGSKDSSQLQNPHARPGHDIAGELREWLLNDAPNLAKSSQR